MRCLAGSSGALRFLCKRKGGQGAARGSVWFQWFAELSGCCQGGNPLHSKQRKTSQMLASTMARPKNGDPLPAMKSSFRRDESHMASCHFCSVSPGIQGCSGWDFWYLNQHTFNQMETTMDIHGSFDIQTEMERRTVIILGSVHVPTGCPQKIFHEDFGGV